LLLGDTTLNVHIECMGLASHRTAIVEWELMMSTVSFLNVRTIMNSGNFWNNQFRILC